MIIVLLDLQIITWIVIIWGQLEVVEEHPIVEWEEEEFDYGPALSLPRQYLPDLDEKLHHSSYRPSRVIVRHP